MPARRKSASADMPQRNILLLEEYDALAAAISSALKKFAPQHFGAVARSLTEAENLAFNLDPELFILDVDPPWAGLTNFLEKMHAAHPNARALVIGGAVPSAIAAERGSSGALQFVEKPFDLAAFGAAIQALLGPWREQDGPGVPHRAPGPRVRGEADAGVRASRLREDDRAGRVAGSRADRRAIRRVALARPGR